LFRSTFRCPCLSNSTCVSSRDCNSVFDSKARKPELQSPNPDHNSLQKV
jgi:hypothetical protein